MRGAKYRIEKKEKLARSVVLCNFFFILNSLAPKGKQLYLTKMFHFNIFSKRKPLTFQYEFIFILKLHSCKSVEVFFEEMLENLPLLL